MRNVNQKVNYDSKYDILYILFSDNSNSYGDDETPGIIYMRDMDTDELTGYTITHFKKMYHNKALPVLPSSFPYSYDELYKNITS